MNSFDVFVIKGFTLSIYKYFLQIFWNLIEMTTFEEFVEICERIRKK